MSEMTDTSLAACLRATAETLLEMGMKTAARWVEDAARRLEAKAVATANHGSPAITINEHAHGDDRP